MSIVRLPRKGLLLAMNNIDCQYVLSFMTISAFPFCYFFPGDTGVGWEVRSLNILDL